MTHHFEILFSEVLIYIFSFGISDTILSLASNIYTKLTIILIIGFIGLTMNYKYAYKDNHK